MLFFHHFGASTKAAPDMGGFVVRTPSNWLHFSKMNGKIAIFLSAPGTKGKRGRDMAKVYQQRGRGPMSILSKSQIDLWFPKNSNILKFKAKMNEIYKNFFWPKKKFLNFKN